MAIETGQQSPTISPAQTAAQVQQSGQPGEASTPSVTPSAQQPGVQRASHDTSAITHRQTGQEELKAAALQTGPPTAHGTANDVYKSLQVLREINGNPAKMLRVVADMSSSSSSSLSVASGGQVIQELGKQVAALDGSEREAMATKLGSRKMVALQVALGEGQATTKSADPVAFKNLQRSMGENLAQMQKKLGVADSADKPPTGKEMRVARKECQKFAKEYGQHVTENRGSFNAEQLRKIGTEKAFPDVSLSTLRNMPADKNNPHVCTQFVLDVYRQQTFLADGQGGKKPLIPQGMPLETDADKGKAVAVAAQRLLDFAGGDKEKCFLLSALSNQRSLCTVEMVNECGGDLAIEGLPKAKTGASHFADGGTANPVFLLTKDDHNSISVKATLLTNPSGHFGIDDIDDKVFYNPKSSSMQISFGYTLEGGDNDANLNVAVTSMDYDCRFVKEFVESEAKNLAESDFSSHAVKQDAAAELVGMAATDTNYAADFHKAENVYSNKAETLALIDQAVTDGALDEAQANSLRSRYEFAEDMLNEGLKIANIEDADELEAALPKMTDLQSDVVVILDDLLMKRDYWDGMGDSSKATQRNTAVAVLHMKLAEVQEQLAGVAVDTHAALDEAHGDIFVQSGSSSFARTSNAAIQSRVACNIITTSLIQAQVDGVAITDDHKALRNEAIQRSFTAESCLMMQERGDEVPISFSAGSKSSVADKATDALTKQLAKGGALPESHKNLNEAQLMQVLVKQFVKDNPEMKPYFKNYGRDFRSGFKAGLGKAGWPEITKTIHDIGADGKLRSYQSTITPAPSLEGRATAEAYQGEGVPCSQRLDGTKASNLAITTMTDENNATMFLGVRHGVFDSYLMTPKGMAKESDETVLKLLSQEHVQSNSGFKQLLPPDLSGDLRGQMQWLREPTEDAKQACMHIRSASNVLAARDSIQALVGADLLLRERALKDGVLDLSVDSLSLLTPDLLRSGSINERTMLKMQDAAWDAVAGNPGDQRDQIPPVTVNLVGIDGEEHPVDVHVRKRIYNFAANAYGLGTTKIATLTKPFMGWDQVDGRNKEMLTGLIGDPADPKIGGEAKNVVNYLHGEGSADQLTAAQLDAFRSKEELAAEFPDAAHLPEHAMSDPIDRAEAIQNLAVEIKQIFHAGAHRSSGVEPMKLSSRLALLNHLMGHHTFFNCKSGKDRTGQLDAEVKYLAANVYQGVFNAPETKPDRIRKTNFVLKSGNLELQQYNTGLRGYKLKGNRALFDQLSSKEAIKTYKGDSSLVKS